MARFCSLPQFLEGESEPRTWATVPLFRCCHGAAPGGSRTSVQRTVRSLDAPAPDRPARDDVDRIAFASRLAWPRGAGLQSIGRIARSTRYGGRNFPVARLGPDLFI